MNPLRPSFAERETFRSALAEAFAEGRIDETEFGRRLGVIEEGERLEDLLGAMEGLPQDQIVVAEPTPIPAATQPPSRRIGRRVFLGVVAAAGGFVVAGGARPLIESLPSPSEALPRAGGESSRYYEVGGLDDPLEWMADHHYADYIELLVYPDMVGATAVNPERPEVLDRVFKNNTLPWEVEPSGQLGKDARTFALDSANHAAVPELARVAPEITGGARTTHMIFNASEVRVYVEGDAYGVGGGSVTWSLDVTELREVYRSE